MFVFTKTRDGHLARSKGGIDPQRVKADTTHALGERTIQVGVYSQLLNFEFNINGN